MGFAKNQSFLQEKLAKDEVGRGWRNHLVAVILRESGESRNTGTQEKAKDKDIFATD
jgi:hypothetical protein